MPTSAAAACAMMAASDTFADGHITICVPERLPVTVTRSPRCRSIAESSSARRTAFARRVRRRCRSYAPDSWTWEIRPVVDQKVGRWYWSINPTLDRSFHGESVNQGVVFSPDFKFSYDFTPKVAGGLEYYGSVGPATGFDAVSQQQHQIFPAIDLNIAPQWEINFGLGVGLTGSTDHLIAKMILGYRFNF